MYEQTVSIGAFGRVINLLDRRIQQLVKEGVLERHKTGRYPFFSNIMARVFIQALADGGGTVIDSEDALFMAKMITPNFSIKEMTCKSGCGRHKMDGEFM